MSKHKQYTVTCPHCGEEFAKADLRRYCSNCFACTGCERYLCAACDEVIEIVPVRPPSFKTSSKGHHPRTE